MPSKPLAAQVAAQLKALVLHHRRCPCCSTLPRVLLKAQQLMAAVEQVLDDSESRPGGWGPDVTCVGILQDALTPMEEP